MLQKRSRKYFDQLAHFLNILKLNERENILLIKIKIAYNLLACLFK